jgi:hypothetical protein
MIGFHEDDIVTPEERRAVKSLLTGAVVWAAMAALIFLVMSACTVTGAPSQVRPAGPREVVTGVTQPACAFLCWLTVTVTDSEGARVNGAESVSITKPITTSTSVEADIGPRAPQPPVPKP